MDEKRCPICGETKPLAEFYRAKGMADGHRGECKECFAKLAAARCRELPGFRDRTIERVQRWRDQNPEKYAELQRRIKARPSYKLGLRRSHLKRKYGITLEQYDEMPLAQGGAPSAGRPSRTGRACTSTTTTTRVTSAGSCASPATPGSGSSARIPPSWPRRRSTCAHPADSLRPDVDALLLAG